MRAHISGHDIANTVRMAHTQRRITFLLLEGETDSYVLRPFLLAGFCEAMVCHAKHRALEAVLELNRTNEAGFLAIVDADFDHLDSQDCSARNCIRTEFHDLEVMLLCSPSLDKVLLERASQDKLRALQEKEGTTLRELLFGIAEPLGRLRLANERRCWGLRFEELNYSRYYDQSNLRIDVDRIIEALVQRSCTGLTVAEVFDGLNSQTGQSHNRLLLCCGHDVVAILALLLRGPIGNWRGYEVTSQVLERELRLAFDSGGFAKTELYSAIREWEQNNPEWRVLAPMTHTAQ